MSEKIDVKVQNLSWQQVAVSAVLLIAIIASYKLFGDLPAGILLVVSSVVNLLLGRTEKESAK